MLRFLELILLKSSQDSSFKILQEYMYVYEAQDFRNLAGSAGSCQDQQGLQGFWKYSQDLSLRVKDG